MRGLQIYIVALMADEEAIRRGHELLAADMRRYFLETCPPHSWSNISTLRYARSNSVTPTLHADDSVLQFSNRLEGLGEALRESASDPVTFLKHRIPKMSSLFIEGGRVTDVSPNLTRLQHNGRRI